MAQRRLAVHRSRLLTHAKESEGVEGVENIWIRLRCLAEPTGTGSGEHSNHGLLGRWHCRPAFDVLELSQQDICGRLSVQKRILSEDPQRCTHPEEVAAVRRFVGSTGERAVIAPVS